MSKRRLCLLGTSGYHPSDERQTSCLMLPELGIVLDAGTGFFRVRDHLATPHLDIFLTHAHLDHIIGITYLFDVVWKRDLSRVTVHAAADKLSEIGEHLFAPALFPVSPPCDFVPLEDEVELPDGGQLSHFELQHPGGAVGFRLDWPEASLAYVTDTTADPEAAYVERIRGVDLLLHECHFPDGYESQARLTGHSCTSPVAQVAAAAGVGRLVLVHINPLGDGVEPIDLDVAQSIFANTELGHDGMELLF